MNRTQIFLYGAGDHAKVLLCSIEEIGEFDIAGLLDDNPDKRGHKVLGYPVLGGADHLYDLKNLGITRALVSIGENCVRSRICDRLATHGFHLTRVIHPTAVILRGAEILEGTVVLPGTYIGPDARIGSNVILSVGVVAGHDCRVGSYAHLCPQVALGGHVHVGDYAMIGMGAAILPGVKIGRYVTVGANAVVTQDVPDHTVIAGVPGRKIG